MLGKTKETKTILANKKNSFKKSFNGFATQL